MELKLVLSTFALVFFAELGDKTQLAALAASAGSRKPWAVFIGASVALLLSTLIAVLLGNVFSRMAKPQVIKGIAGVIFLVFGALFIADACRTARAAPAPVTRVGKPGALARIALEMAAGFEAAAAEDYSRLAAAAEEPSLRALYATLAEEEAEHLKDMRRLLAADARGEPEAGEVARAELPTPTPIGDAAAGALSAAAEHERSMAEFYRALAASTRFPSMKNVFVRLAEEETRHLDRLEQVRQRAGLGDETANGWNRG